MPASPDPRARSQDRDLRRRRRAVQRANHPDLGGDAAELLRQIRLLEIEQTRGQVTFVRTPRGLHLVPAWWRHRHRAPRVR